MIGTRVPRAALSPIVTANAKAIPTRTTASPKRTWAIPHPAPYKKGIRKLLRFTEEYTANRCGTLRKARDQGIRTRATKENTTHAFSHRQRRRYLSGTIQLPTITPPAIARRIPKTVPMIYQAFQGDSSEFGDLDESARIP
jgi:hypothetical protein